MDNGAYTVIIMADRRLLGDTGIKVATTTAQSPIYMQERKRKSKILLPSRDAPDARDQ